jgi:putative FmdB family regulatory protein
LPPLNRIAGRRPGASGEERQALLPPASVRAAAIIGGGMPIYEYKCADGHVFDVIQKMSDEPLAQCQECDAPAERVLHPVAVHFKGSGFYTTDYGKKKAAAGNGASPDGSKQSKESKSGESQSSESKSSESRISESSSDSKSKATAASD